MTYLSLRRVLAALTIGIGSLQAGDSQTESSGGITDLVKLRQDIRDTAEQLRRANKASASVREELDTFESQVSALRAKSQQAQMRTQTLLEKLVYDLQSRLEVVEAAQARMVEAAGLDTVEELAERVRAEKVAADKEEQRLAKQKERESRKAERLARQEEEAERDRLERARQEAERLAKQEEKEERERLEREKREAERLAVRMAKEEAERKAEEERQEVAAAKAAARARAEQESAQWVARATARAEHLRKLQYPVSDIVIECEDEDDRMLVGLGDGTDILSIVRVNISEEDGVVVADRKGKKVWVRELFSEEDSRLFSAGALNAICSAVLGVVNDAGVVGVSIMPHPGDIAPDGRDLRPPGRTELRLLPHFSRVAQVRTIDADKPAEDPARIDNPEHQWVREQSPVSPDGHDLLDRRSIDEYVARINRHPGRRASVAISQGERPGEAVLDYIVDESSPWRVQLQTSNTGTDTTDEIRHRLSLAHYQLTGHDDILSLDYVHSGSQVDAPARYIGGSYQYPFGPTFKTRVYASYSDYAADEIGQHDLEFEGESKKWGVDLGWNFYQRGSLFLDLQLGLRLDDFSTTDRQLDTKAAESVAMGSAGVSLEHRGRTSRTSASIGWDHSLPSIMGTEEERLVALGRSDVDAAWDVLVFNLAHNMYLDPFIFGTSWGNPSAWRSSCLAHELRLSLSSQTALEDRLIPQAQRVIGGLYSVRGYDSGEIVGDDAVVARVEYGLHLPRMLKPGPPVALGGHRLRLRPMGPFGATDVDVVLRLFTDYARAWISDIDSVSESDQELWSAGVGLDLNLVDRLTLSLDWGQALMDVVSKADADVTKSGDSQLHFSLTLAF